MSETKTTTTKATEVKTTKRFEVIAASQTTDHSKMADAIKTVDQLKQNKENNIKLLDTKANTTISWTRRPNTASYIVKSED